MSDDRRQQALEHVLANGRGDDALRAFLDQACFDCAEDLAIAEADLAVLALALPPVSPPAALRERVLAQVAAAAAGKPDVALAAPVPAVAPLPASVPAPIPFPRRGRLWVAAAAAAAVLCAIAGGWLTATVLASQDQMRTNAMLARLNQDQELAKVQGELTAMLKARDAQIGTFDERIRQFTQLATAQESAVRDAIVLVQRLGNDVGERDARLADLTRKIDDLGRASAVATAEAQARTREAQVLLGKLTERDAQYAALDQRQSELLRLVSASGAHQQRLADLTGILAAKKLTIHNVPGDGGRQVRVHWDHDGARWHVAATGLPQPPPGRVFELWFITAQGQKVAAGLVPVDAQGNGEIIVPVPRDLPGITIAAITDEPPGGTLAPTGQIIIAGKL